MAGKYQKRVVSLGEGTESHCIQSTRFRFRQTTEKATHGSKQGNMGRAEARGKKAHSPEQAGKTG